MMEENKKLDYATLQGGIKTQTIDGFQKYLDELKEYVNIDINDNKKKEDVAIMGVLSMIETFRKEFSLNDNSISKIVFSVLFNYKYVGNQIGIKITNYDDLLYPDFKKEFENKTINKNLFEILQQKAKFLLENAPKNTASNVKKHWKTIIDGKPPYGFKIIDNQ